MWPRVAIWAGQASAAVEGGGAIVLRLYVKARAGLSLVPAILPARSGCLAGCWSAWPLPLFRPAQVLELGARLRGCCPGGDQAVVMLTSHMRWLQVLPPALAAEETTLCERYEMVGRM